MRVSDQVAQRIAAAFGAWHVEFRGMTRRARGRFARREWQGGQEDAAARLASYQGWVERLVAELGVLPPNPRGHWSRVKDAFAREVAGWPDADLAATFFNSVTRRLLGTVGSDPTSEFTEALVPLDAGIGGIAHRTLLAEAVTVDLVRRILDGCPIGAPWEDQERDIELAAAEIVRQLRDLHDWPETRVPITAEVLPGVFYRNKGAYVVGRLRSARGLVPLVLALTHEAHGVALDAVLTSPDETSAVFGFTRSYFHADLEHPAPVIGFLASIMPVKREDELWTAIGYHKHGKTVFYRTLMRHLEHAGRALRGVGGRPGHGDGGLHAAVAQRRVQGDQGPLRPAEDGDACAGAGTVRPGVCARPGRAAGRRAGVRSPAVPAVALRARAAGRTARRRRDGR